MTDGEELPAGWVSATLADLGRWGSGGTPSKKRPEYHGGTIPWVLTGDLDDGFVRDIPNSITEAGLANSSAKLFPAGTLLMAMYGATIGKLGVLKREAATNQACAALVPTEANADALSYLYFFLRFQREQFKKAGKGGAQPNISQTVIKQKPIPVAPLAEQQRIVEKIETLFAELDKGEEALREVQKLLARYRQSVLKAAVTGTLTADWRAANGPPKETGEDLLTRILKTRRETWQGRGDYKEPIGPNTDELPDLPEGWAWASMDELLGHLTSGSRDWKQYYGEGTGTFIMAQNVRPMRFDLTERFLINPPQDSPDAVRSQACLNDILITIVGANTGDVCRFPLDVEEHYVCQSVALMRLVEPELSGFVELYLSGKGAGRDQLEKHIYGAGRPHLSFEQLRSIAIPLPPRDERTELMGIVNEAFANLAHVQEACASEARRSAGLRQSVLKAAFSGKLVPQDPSDETAEKLLERIRAARSEKPKAKRKKAAA